MACRSQKISGFIHLFKYNKNAFLFSDENSTTSLEPFGAPFLRLLRLG